MPFQIDDILAAVFLSIVMFRRLETLSIQREDNVHVPDEQFFEWRTMALSAYRLAALACAGKVFLSLGWFAFAVRFLPPQALIAGVLIFIAWVVALVFAWRKASEARGLRARYGIVGRARK